MYVRTCTYVQTDRERETTNKKERYSKGTGTLLEGCHHIGKGEVLIVVPVKRVTTRLHTGTASVTVCIKPQLQVLGK